MASISALRPLNWLRICAASAGVFSCGRLGSNMDLEKGRVGDLERSADTLVRWLVLGS
jgi:hypothetical protein